VAARQTRTIDHASSSGASNPIYINVWSRPKLRPVCRRYARNIVRGVYALRRSRTFPKLAQTSFILASSSATDTRGLLLCAYAITTDDSDGIRARRISCTKFVLLRARLFRPWPAFRRWAKILASYTSADVRSWHACVVFVRRCVTVGGSGQRRKYDRRSTIPISFLRERGADRAVAYLQGRGEINLSPKDF